MQGTPDIAAAVQSTGRERGCCVGVEKPADGMKVKLGIVMCHLWLGYYDGQEETDNFVGARRGRGKTAGTEPVAA